MVIFWKDEIAQRNGNILGFFLLKQINYIFTYICSFKTWFVVGILRFQKWFDVDILGFQIGVYCRYFGLFWLVDCLWSENWANFFWNHPVTLLFLRWPLTTISKRLSNCLQYKHITVVNNDSRVFTDWSHTIEHHSRVVNCDSRCAIYTNLWCLQYMHHFWWSSIDDYDFMEKISYFSWGTFPKHFMYASHKLLWKLNVY